MKVALIPPVPDLERFAGGANVHMALAHLYESRTFRPAYRAFFQRRRRLGEFVILDNGADELTEGLDVQRVLEIAAELTPHEIVLPDRQQDPYATIELVTGAAHYLRTSRGAAAWAAAGKPRLMIVPQGQTPDEWQACFLATYRLAHGALVKLGSPNALTVGVAKNHDHLFADHGRLESLFDWLDNRMLMYDEHYTVHMLGWPRRLETLRELAVSHPWIRSVDSARPFTYAIAGERCSDGGDNPNRPEDYFATAVPFEHEHLAWQNIHTFREYARDA